MQQIAVTQRRIGELETDREAVDLRELMANVKHYVEELGGVPCPIVVSPTEERPKVYVSTIKYRRKGGNTVRRKWLVSPAGDERLSLQQFATRYNCGTRPQARKLAISRGWKVCYD